MERLLSSLSDLDPDALELEYGAVRSHSTLMKRDLGLTTEAGARKENIKKNRYKDILPYDQTRVVLSLLTSDLDTDYINASVIEGATADKRYIASQAPLSSTVTDLWRMIWQHDVKVIVMACREVEMGKKKCECYWAQLHQATTFGPFTISSQGETHPNEDVVVRALTVTYQQLSRSLTQYQFLSWPDHDIPYEAAGVLDLLERVRASQRTCTSPVLIHCSAGCGRTGVICALDYIYDLLVTKPITTDFSIMKIVLELRRQRPSAVQTKDQYRFIFSSVACLIRRLLESSGRQLYINELKTQDKHTTVTPASCNKRSLRLSMNDTYAVVNKPKHLLPPASNPPHSGVDHARSSRSLPPSHHYDNDPAGASAAPVYSRVRPRNKPLSLQLSATPIYDMASPTNIRPGEGLLSQRSNGEHQVAAAEQLPPTDDDYEDFSSSVADTPGLCPPGGIGFNCRIQKPKGPRDPPAEWSRLER
ncbi:tyrosine-protein phosphatase non-receptor type 18 isoform X1 [Pleuronectes platessa]|uniref:tyrosine-protein phosphatase non-receptor type 18 isoform X1 n=1 Tax=Pleuronectes platessa TaxID=8262 RepID=UPI00232A4F4A|nr:tyrosine-protein phosphatase non-receptor type 18 isoform X1 [Pleuronectes platessa]XP_053280864.1 tyrosine-protein phosphatase non-receptor type 18 isoform X1 [Pleuronectes platessa]